jgi:DNA invertase Pin-like site-specific DNA recombinase
VSFEFEIKLNLKKFSMEYVNNPLMEFAIHGAKSRKEVAQEYGISNRTLYRWLKDANIILPSGLIDPLHLKIIYKTFGTPKSH